MNGDVAIELPWQPRWSSDWFPNQQVAGCVFDAETRFVLYRCKSKQGVWWAGANQLVWLREGERVAEGRESVCDGCRVESEMSQGGTQVEGEGDAAAEAVS